MVYAFAENFMLPFSHDEVVHGKGSLLGRMPGDEWQQFANLRLLFGYMFTHPGTQLIFMGGEFGQRTEWSDTKGLDWDALDYHRHKEVQTWVKDLNRYYTNTPALYEKQFSPEGFEWIDGSDSKNSVLIYIRKGEKDSKPQVVVCHFTPTVIYDYKIGVPEGGIWKEMINSDNKKYGGGDILNEGELHATEKLYHNKSNVLSITIAPLAIMIFEQVKKPNNNPAKSASKKTELHTTDSKTKLFNTIGKAKADEKDDLKKIKGIGPKLELALNQVGIYTFEQLAKMTDIEYKLLDDCLGKYRGRAKKNDWARQALKVKE